jgi:hypothetical protein
MKNLFKIFRNIFRYFLLSLAIVLTVCSIIAIIFVVIDASKLEWSFDKNGMAHFLTLFQPFQILLASTFIVIPAYIGLETLISKLHYQEVEVLLNLRKLLSDKENSEIHKILYEERENWINEISGKDKNDIESKVNNYLGILELINILIDKGVVNMKNFNKQFGYRVENAHANKDIIEHIKKDIAYWKDLIRLFKKMNLDTSDIE